MRRQRPMRRGGAVRRQPVRRRAEAVRRARPMWQRHGPPMRRAVATRRRARSGTLGLAPINARQVALALERLEDLPIVVVRVKPSAKR